MLNSEMEVMIKRIPIDECYKLMHLLEQRVDNEPWKNNIKQSLTSSGIYTYFDTTTQVYESILIDEIKGDVIQGYRISDGEDVITPVESISLERSYEYIGSDRVEYDMSVLPMMDETPLVGVNLLGFPVLCAGFKLESGRKYIFSPISQDKEINQGDLSFYVATERERELMDTLLGR